MMPELSLGEFEKWARGQIANGMYGWDLKRGGEGYDSGVVNALWIGWQACAAASGEALRCEAVKNLVDKLDVILPKIDGMCVIENFHGRPYTGPNLGQELERVRELFSLAAPDSTEGK